MPVCFSLLQNLADLLYKAAAEGGYLDLHKVAEILGVPNTSSAADNTISGQCTCLSVSRKS